MIQSGQILQGNYYRAIAYSTKVNFIVNSHQSLLQVFRSRKLAALALLGFSSGLPLFLTSKTLQVWMTEAKIDLGVIGLFAIVALPYSLKFLWAPFLDRFALPFLGQRRGWLLVTQIGLLLAIAAMSLQNPAQDAQVLQVLVINVLIITFLSATQDIAGDAYRTDVLEPLEMEAGASIWVLGYRVALLATSWLALRMAEVISWNTVYLIMAALMLVGIAATLWAPEPPLSPDMPRRTPPSVKDIALSLGLIWLIAALLGGVLTGYLKVEMLYWAIATLLLLWVASSFLFKRPDSNNQLESSSNYSLNDAIYQPFQNFFQRYGGFSGSLILLFIVLYKLGDALVGNMANPFLVSLGFDKPTIGDIQGGMGFLATTVGVLAGGAIMTQLGINRCLWIFGLLQLVSNLGYYVLAIAGKQLSLLIVAINVENFCAGLVTVVSVAFLMRLCDHRFTTTQFALFSSLMAISRDVIAAPAGVLAKATGWAPFFLITIIAAIPGLLMLPAIAPWNQPERAIEGVPATSDSTKHD
jgi:MFS transporter, PAT family, beta-lactamase induction signal transducer AmpG